MLKSYSLVGLLILIILNACSPKQSEIVVAEYGDYEIKNLKKLMSRIQEAMKMHLALLLKIIRIFWISMLILR